MTVPTLVTAAWPIAPFYVALVYAAIFLIAAAWIMWRS